MTPQRATVTAVLTNLLIIAVAIALGLITAGKPSRYFGEGRFTTIWSCLQLLCIAFLSSRIFQARRAQAPEVGPYSAAWVWACMAIGFVFLAADDAFEIHEQLDLMVHGVFKMEESAWTDRLDDAIIALYGLVGIAVLWLFRREILRFASMRRPLAAGFFFLMISAACDAVSNRDDMLIWLCGDVLAARRLSAWVAVGDGAFTLLAEGLFLVAFYAAYQAASVPPQHVPDPP